MADTFQPIGAVTVNVMAQLPIFLRYTSVVRTVAHRLARRVIERQLQAEGVRVTYFPYAQLRVLTREYLAAHPELLDQAAAVVQSSPTLRKMAEIEQREQERRRRKSSHGQSSVCDWT